jgi:hypothetical protein
MVASLGQAVQAKAAVGKEMQLEGRPVVVRLLAAEDARAVVAVVGSVGPAACVAIEVALSLSDSTWTHVAIAVGCHTAFAASDGGRTAVQIGEQMTVMRPLAPGLTMKIGVMDVEVERG